LTVENLRNISLAPPNEELTVAGVASGIVDAMVFADKEAAECPVIEVALAILENSEVGLAEVGCVEKVRFLKLAGIALLPAEGKIGDVDEEVEMDFWDCGFGRARGEEG